MNKNELYCLLIPLGEGRLIVPRALVAEVIRFSEPEHVNASPWLKGMVNWNGNSVPVVNFEQLCGAEGREPGGRTRIVVLQGLATDTGSGYVGIASEGFPQLLRINRELLSADPTTGYDEDKPVISRVRMINEVALIPDVEMLEHLIQEDLAA